MSGLYETDFYRWCCEQAAVLREQQPEGLDWANVAEEIESMGRSERRAVGSELMRILIHMLQLRYAKRRTGEQSWSDAIFDARMEVEQLIEDSPSLRGELVSLLPKAYGRACREAGRELGLVKGEALMRFPRECPWTIGAILEEDIVPKEIE